jgi:hypothetical protein
MILVLSESDPARYRHSVMVTGNDFGSEQIRSSPLQALSR